MFIYYVVNTESRRSGHYLEMGSTTMLSKYVIIYQKFNTTSYIFLDYTNCKDYFDKGINKSGQYYILKNGAVIQVSCFFEGMDYETCYDYFKVGFNSSGLYYVYVDGISYQINCNFESGMSYDTKE